jgi:hypothetical protein
MHATKFRRRARLTLALTLLTPAIAHADPWVGEAKSLSADFSYQYVPATETVIDPDLSIPDRGEQNHIITIGAEYVPIPKLGIEASIPLIMIKYTGSMPHDPPGKWDDDKFHTSLTDLRFGARYQLLEEPILAVTPHIAFSIPVMDYETIGFAIGGRHLKQAHFGVSIGRTLDPILPALYFATKYEFTLSEKFDLTPETEKIGQNRSDFEAQIGYVLLGGKLDLNVGANWRVQHGGIDFRDFPMLSAELTQNHDPILDEEYIFLGGGVGYAVSEKLSIALVTRFFIRGYNTHDQTLYGFNLSWQAL